MCSSIFHICRDLSLVGCGAAVHKPDLCGTFFKVQCYRNVNSSIQNQLGPVVLLLNGNEQSMNTGNSISSKAEKYNM